jgi:ribokinase
MSVAIIDAAGNYGASVVSGANLHLAREQVQQIPARVLILQNEIREEINILAAAAAHAAHATVILNAAPWRNLPAALLKSVDVIVLNAVEKAQSGAALDRLQKTQIVTKGAKGVVILHKGETHTIAPHPVRQVNAHGAGDVFCGALAARLAAGLPFIEAVRFANAAGALYVSGLRDQRLSSEAVIQLSGR